MIAEKGITASAVIWFEKTGGPLCTTTSYLRLTKPCFSNSQNKGNLYSPIVTPFSTKA